MLNLTNQSSARVSFIYDVVADGTANTWVKLYNSRVGHFAVVGWAVERQAAVAALDVVAGLG